MVLIISLILNILWRVPVIPLFFFVYEIEFLTYTIFDDCKYEDDHFEEILTNE